MDITEDLRITVGGAKCNVTKIGYSVVICAPERPDVFTDNEPSQLVVVNTNFQYKVLKFRLVIYYYSRRKFDCTILAFDNYIV